MNPFTTPSPAELRSATTRLRARLPAIQHIARDADDDGTALAPAVVAIQRQLPYQPRKSAALIIDALMRLGPMTSAGIKRTTGVPVKQVPGALQYALKHGVVVIVSRDPIVWSATT